MSQEATTAERMVGQRTIPAPPSAVFAVLRDPSRHHESEPGDWVRDAIDPEPIDRVGQVFTLNMFNVHAGGDYVMQSRVSAYETDHAIAWEPGQAPADGQELRPGGWEWSYALTPVPEGTKVTLTYDWSNTPQFLREAIGGMPPFGPEFLDASLQALEQASMRTP